MLLKHSTSAHIEIQTRRRYQAAAHVTYYWCNALISISQAYKIALWDFTNGNLHKCECGSAFGFLCWTKEDSNLMKWSNSLKELMYPVTLAEKEMAADSNCLEKSQESYCVMGGGTIALLVMLCLWLIQYETGEGGWNKLIIQSDSKLQ